MGKLLHMAPREFEDGDLSENQDVELWLESTDGLINLIDAVSDRLKLRKIIVVEAFIGSLDGIKSNLLSKPP